jgi:hypothetical protein
VPDSAEAFAFYHTALGLRPMEAVHCCNPECPPDEKGIVKYDAGNLLLSTHHIHRTPVVDDYGTVYSARSVDPAHVGGIVPVFVVDDIANAVGRLKSQGVGFAGDVMRSHRGKLARFSTAAGHTFLLHEPNSGAPRPDREKPWTIAEASGT